MKHDLVLIIPPSPWLISDVDLPMLGVLCVSAFVKQYGYDVKICDLAGVPETAWEIPDGKIYGITGVSPQYIYIKKIADKIREEKENAFIVAGGVHASTCSDHLLNTTIINSCIIGEGEMAMLAVLKGNKAPKVVGEVIQNLDILPFPDREGIDFKKYLQADTFRYLIGDCIETTMTTARGCPFNCSYCSSIWEKRVRGQSVDRVFNEVQMLKDKYKVNLIYFTDDTFILNRTKVLGLAKKLQQTNIYWHCLGRVDLCPEDVLKAMKDSGCVQMTFGYESGSNKILKFANKHATVEQAYTSITTLHKVGIQMRGQLVVGLPGETDKTVEETANFIRNAQEVKTFGLHIFRPFPGCPVWKDPKKYDYEIDKATDFSSYHTVGKPNGGLKAAPEVLRWYKYLRDVIDNRNIDKRRVEGHV